MSEILTQQQREILEHTIGLEHRLKEHRLKVMKPKRGQRRNTLTEDSFRNYFCETVGGMHELDITILIRLGLMSRGETINGGRDYYVHATEAGIKEALTRRAGHQ